MTKDEHSLRGSLAHRPDLDWSQMRETVLLMELAGGQIEAAMKDSSSSVEVLTDSFTTMAGYMRMIGETASHLPDNDEAAAVKAELLGATEHVTAMMRQTIVAFQFYDRLVQRLSHVNHSLAALSNLVGDNSRLFNPGEWLALQEKIRSRYTMKEEVDMFEAVLAGMPVQQALDTFMAKMNNRPDDIELF